MLNNITRLVLIVVLLLLIFIVFINKFVQTKKAILLSIVFVLIYTLFSKNILEYTTEKCINHIYGKKFFEMEFPFFYNIFNPSIIKIPSGYLCCIRCSTLTQKNFFYYLYGQFFYDSFIFFLELDYQGNYKIVFPSNQNLNRNLEDPRIIKHRNHYIISASEYLSKNNNFPVLMIYDTNYNFIKRVDYNRTNYFGIDEIRSGVQKNWCLFHHENELYIHTDVYPNWKVFKIDIETGNMDKIVDKKYCFEINYHLRCSTSWKIYDDNYYICGIHTKTKEKMPTIRSILVLIDRKTFLPVFQTHLLCLEPVNHNRTQFLSGLETDDIYIILSYGINDSKIILKKISKNRLKFVPYTFSSSKRN